MAPDRSRRKRWLMLGLKLAIVAAVVWFVRDTISKGWHELAAHEPDQWDWQPGWLALAGGLYLLGLLPSALFWRRILRVLGQEAQLGETLRAYYIGHLGKYVPGKAMVVVIRAGLIRGSRVQTGVAAVSVFVETLTMMSVGAFLAAAILAVGFREQTLLFWVAIGLMIVAGLPTIPPIFRRLVRLAGVGKSDPSTAERLRHLGYGTLLCGWVTVGLGWCLLGLSLWATLRGMGVSDVHLLTQFPLFTASVSLAMVAGFLSLIPGGAVVRELVLAKLMVPTFGSAVALLSAVVLRLVWLVSEAVISGILYPWGWRERRCAGREV